MSTLWETEAKYIRILGEMKRNGVKIDREFCKPKIEIGTSICEGIKDELGWNPGSSQQIGEVLLGEFKYPVVRRTDKGNPSFDKYAMEEYELFLEKDGSDLAKKILRYRGWQKTVSSNYIPYIKLSDKNSILHPGYKPHGTRTCRVSCEDPNLQQIPKESPKEWNGDLKRAFVERPEYLLYDLYRGYDWPVPDLSGNSYLVEFDYSQLETRLAAAVAKETELIEAFCEDIDVFQVMADRLSWPRDHAKLFNYMTMYGAGVRKIALVFKLSQSEAKDMRDAFFGAYPRLLKTATRAKMIAAQQKYITYWSGRRRHFGVWDEYRKAFNAYLQGGAFEIVKRSTIRAREQVQYPMVLTVHDSIIWEVPESEFNNENMFRIKTLLEAVPQAETWGVPFKVDWKVWGK